MKKQGVLLLNCKSCGKKVVTKEVFGGECGKLTKFIVYCSDTIDDLYHRGFAAA